nr:hypothetical protein [Bacteroidales bacterium]
AVRTYISGCTSSASVEFAGSASNSSPAYFGGILGKGGAGVSLHNCRIVDCKMKFTSSCDSAYVAGIAGKASSVDGCTMNGTLTVKDGNVGELYLAGVTPVINEASNVSGNTFGGVLVVGGNSLHNYVGGLYSKTVTGFTKVFDSGSDGSSSSGTIRIDSHRDAADCRVYAGGILGCAAPSATLTFKDYSVQAKFILDHAKDRKAGYYCVGGVLGGTDPGTKAKSVTFEGINYQGLMSFRFATGVASGIVKGYYGGVAGFVKGPSTFKDCTNQGNVGVTTSDSNINAGAKNETSANFVGGVAGYLEGGNVTMTSCKNEAMVLNLFYCNLSAYNNPDLNYLQDFRGAFCGGILGAFDMHLEPSGETITLSDCDCSASVDGIRGMVGGVVGFCQNATITNCDYSSKEYTTLGNQIGAHQGGVAGAVSKATIEGSVVKATIHAGQPGSSDFASPGGIVGRVIPGDKVVVKDCRFYGTVIATPSNGTTLYPGGIVGAGCANTEVKDCSFGGTIKETDKYKTTETLSKEISKNNLATYVFGNQTGTATNISVWAGQ